jgi:hypothetical protein
MYFYWYPHRISSLTFSRPSRSIPHVRKQPVLQPIKSRINFHPQEVNSVRKFLGELIHIMPARTWLEPRNQSGRPVKFLQFRVGWRTITLQLFQ